MRRKISHLLSVAFCASLVAACGSNSDGSPSPTPTPTGSGTPTPTPTATPTPSAADYDFTTAFTDSVSNAFYIYAYFTPTAGGAETFSDGNRRVGQSGINYTVSPNTVTVQYPTLTDPISFAQADLTGSSDSLRTYANANGTLELQRQGEYVLVVTHGQTQPYIQNTVPGSLRSRAVSIFFNTVTTTSAISSNLTYTGTPVVVGGALGTTPATAITTASTNFTVNSTNSVVSGTIQIFETTGGTTTLIASLPISATVQANSTFTGNIDTATYDGSFIGALAGPNREQVFILFNVGNGTDRKFVGHYIGQR